ncbi:uncharacterized protein LOC111684261 [Lucilia cuprina]|uniref:uncharacterized protein LOC111684261 n=1 Tax=Lucilia cuprina TaxID=7375 RepID=UPI001F069E99|nr:uncharacterized protein LOC111684261 [Lucilia cuprina]
MKLFILLLSFCCLAAALQEAQIKEQWLRFKSKYGKKYRNALEDSQRFVKFKKNLLKIKQHNQRYEQGLESYEMSLNPFTDMDMKEVQQTYMGFKMPENSQELLQNATFYQPPLKQRFGLPTHVDWRDRGAITPVKDQKACGSCWAFASVAALEAHYYIKHKENILLSEQNLVDCVTENWGCDGGWMIPSFQYVTINNGINPESVYPYEAVDGVCRHQYNKGPINKAYVAISPDNEEHLQLAVALNGPVAVAIQANNNFMNYKSGVFDDPDCSKIANHAVLVVGYGTENGKDYWLIKNSWSSYWGDNGYIKMARNKNNQCAIARYASYPVVIFKRKMQLKLLILLLLSVYCLEATLLESFVQKHWSDFKHNYGKKYRSRGENNKSFQNFKRNLQIISEHNERFVQGLETYKMSINPFTDKDLQEMETSYMGLKISESFRLFSNKQMFLNTPQYSASNNKKKIPPLAKDWRDEGAISAVKDQEACGSCWAFSSTGALEAKYFLKYNKSIVLSEQNLIDCVTENWGCEGGWMIPCFDYVHYNEGINPETQYPYEANNGECRFNSNFIAATCTGYQTIRQNDEQHLLEAVASEGPVSVAIAVNSKFMFYDGGIYDDVDCSQLVNHAVLVVGYGTENGQDYWLVKNSWSSQWGDGGYIKMARNKNNQCAIAKYASYPVV